MVQSFNDRKGKTWDLTLTAAGAKRVKALTGVDLFEALEGRLLESLVGSPSLLVDVVYAIAKPQADKQNVTDKEFGESMAGEAIDAATSAFLEALVAFFPPSRRRVLEMALEKTKALQALVVEKAADVLGSGKIDEVIKDELAKLDDPGDLLKAELESSRASGDSSTRPPESLASTPTR